MGKLVPQSLISITWVLILIIWFSAATDNIVTDGNLPKMFFLFPNFLSDSRDTDDVIAFPFCMSIVGFFVFITKSLKGETKTS